MVKVVAIAKACAMKRQAKLKHLGSRVKRNKKRVQLAKYKLKRFRSNQIGQTCLEKKR